MTSYFASKNIKANPSKVIDRQDQIIKTQMRNKIAQMMGKNDLFSSTLKEKMITDCQARGLDPNQVRAFIDNIGIPENKIDWIQQYIHD